MHCHGGKTSPPSATNRARYFAITSMARRQYSSTNAGLSRHFRSFWKMSKVITSFVVERHFTFSETRKPLVHLFFFPHIVIFVSCCNIKTVPAAFVLGEKQNFAVAGCSHESKITKNEDQSKMILQTKCTVTRHNLPRRQN